MPILLTFEGIVTVSAVPVYFVNRPLLIVNSPVSAVFVSSSVSNTCFSAFSGSAASVSSMYSVAAIYSITPAFSAACTDNRFTPAAKIAAPSIPVSILFIFITFLHPLPLLCRCISLQFYTFYRTITSLYFFSVRIFICTHTDIIFLSRF